MDGRRRSHEFATGDIATAEVASGKKVAINRNRAAIMTSGYLNIQTSLGVAPELPNRSCRVIRKVASCGDHISQMALLFTLGGEVSAPGA
ncbi:MAG TPA: hypothetical protein DCP92_06545 [Nitrospiraceae bacterium]|nr:hypothetical protein [Nitrospiraceae bacterium]